MGKRGQSDLVSPLVALLGVSAICIGLSDPQIAAVGGPYEPPPLPPPPPPRINTTPLPIDVTHPAPNVNSMLPPGGDPLSGIMEVSGFPSQDSLKGPTDFILCQPADVVQRESPYMVKLVKGEVLASVRRPSSMGMIETPLGLIGYSANSDSFVSFENGVLRVRNMDGMGQAIRVQITSGPLAGKTFAVAPGYELVIADHKLTHGDMRPGDGIMRRQAKVFADGYASAAQFSPENVLQQSAIVSQMKQGHDSKNTRILSDMSRMAAVLNHLNGTQGYNP